MMELLDEVDIHEMRHDHLFAYLQASHLYASVDTVNSSEFPEVAFDLAVESFTRLKNFFEPKGLTLLNANFHQGHLVLSFDAEQFENAKGAKFFGQFDVQQNVQGQDSTFVQGKIELDKVASGWLQNDRYQKLPLGHKVIDIDTGRELMQVLGL